MKTRRHLLVVMAALAAAGPTRAAVTPSPGPEDPRIQTVKYDPNEVVAVRVALGYALSVEFSPDESIENVAIGNSAVWQAVANHPADHLFIKPMQGATNTNLTVVTDAREYNFDLTAVPTPDATTPFSLHFVYPTTTNLTSPKVEQKTMFRFSGAMSIRPVTMFDDGVSTFIGWRDGGQVPAIFMVNDQGREVLVNGAMRSGQYVIDAVSDRFVFRLGGEDATAMRLEKRGTAK